MSRRHLDAGSHSPDHSFTIEQFESLVSSALDIQGISDSALSFAFGGTVYPPSSALSDSDRKAQRRKTGTFSRLRDVFTKRFDASDASSRTLPPETRRLASKSVPAFSPLQSPPPPSSKSLINLELGHTYLDFPSLPCPTTPAATSTSLPSPASNDFSNGSAFDGPSSGNSPCGTPSPNARSFLNVKPLSIPKLIKKPSGPPSPYFPPTPPDQMASLPVSSPTFSNDSAHAETEGLRSFFDDSGFEEDLRTLRSKSRTGFRSFFSSATPERNGRSPGRSRYEHKALPPTPVTTESIKAIRCSESRPNDTSDSRYKSEDRVASHFSPSLRKQELRNANSDSLRSPDSKAKLDTGTNRMANWIVRSAGSAPRNVRRTVKTSPPPYPSPTSPLPPTPKLPSVGLPAAHLSTSGRIPTTSDAGDTSLDSVDSVEILSWRMPNLKQQVSKSSTSSCNRAHAMGRPSRGSIRERLGLGTRLYVHVPSPAQFLSDSVKMSESQEGRYSLTSFANDEDRQHQAAPSSAGTPSSARIPLPRLASTSFVSLRSIATITAGNKGGEWSEDAEREDALEVDRAFTPDDDPFAADPLTPISPVNPIFDSRAKKEKYRSFMPLGNDSNVSLVSNEIPISAPASLSSWHYRLGSNPNLSSPALTPKSSLRKDLQVVSKPPSPLVEGLGIRDRTPSPLCPENNLRSLNRAISRVKKIQSNMSVYSRRNINHGSSAVGHTQSRPHSPFPMLLRPGIAKSVPTIKRESKRPSVASIVWNGANGQAMGTSLASPPLSPQWEPRLDRHGPRQVAEPYAPSAKDADAARSNMIELPERSMVSPTAWLLDMDDYDDATLDVAEQPNVLALDMTAATQATSRRDSYEVCRIVKTDENPRTADVQYSPPSRVLREPESESQIQIGGDTMLLRSSQDWPLPPPCTVIVDEDSGEGYHLVEPVVELVQADSIPQSPRHSIHFPKRHSGCASIESRSSRGSQKSPPVLQKLSRSQTRLLAKQFGRSHAGDEGHTVTSPSRFHSPDNIRTDRSYERSRSTTSLASAGTAFYSARSTPSRGSDKSTFSFANSRSRGASSNERSSGSSRSPRRSSDHQTRDTILRLEPDLTSHYTSA